MRHWERDLVDHLVLLMTLTGDEPLDAALATLKSEFPSLPSDEAVRSGSLATTLPRRDAAPPAGSPAGRPRH
jgi:hypothetical protein